MDPLFIVVEGIDGAGTTTCSKLLVKTLNDMQIEALWTKEPSNGTIGRHIRRILKKEEAADEDGIFPLFLADRHDHIANIVRPNIQQGTTVVCDRYAYSTWVYQQDNYDQSIIEIMQRRCMVPDLVFVLLCPVEVCMERISGRDVIERYEVPEQQVRYAERYKKVPRLGDEQIIVLDSYNNGPEHLAEMMLERIGL
jgi:dTMP kinase